MLLQEYDITFIHIEGKDNILADTISRLHTINIYEDPAEDKLQHSPIVQNTAQSSKATDNIQVLDSRNAQQLLNITTKMLQNHQKQDRFCRKKACELQTGLQKQKYFNKKILVNNLEINVIVMPAPLLYTLLYEFHNCKGHQGSTRTFNIFKQKCWCKGMRLDVKNHINSCFTCSKTCLTLHITHNCI